jgi:phosphoglycolate phosphatase
VTKYILFDLDGTLTDSYEGVIKSIKYALSHFGIAEENPDTLRSFIGPSLHDTFAGYDIEVEKAVELYRERFEKGGLFENALYEGIAELLEALKAKGYVLAIASSKAEVYVKQIAERFDIAQYFAFMGGAEFDGSRSSKEGVMRHVISVLGVCPADDVYMVGDRKYDIYGAKQLGIQSVGVLYGYGDRVELENAGADYIVDDVSSLKALFG